MDVTSNKGYRQDRVSLLNNSSVYLIHHIVTRYNFRQKLNTIIPMVLVIAKQPVHYSD